MNEDVECSFCAKCADGVRKLFAGPKVHICNECVVFLNNYCVVTKEPLRALRQHIKDFFSNMKGGK